ncbi:X-ray repair cross-complementing protein 5 [Rhizophlyctis rosea]|uniref:ATP-dependent DNA helicase II subunit 2 n=1 Tax=Rhizophlyctis rosea TaxID=64517 RepID=A0AAD5X829_9FUNG|nr:X-ray repair cross-complementing protein 5 [Rhizophlyctis rosea]
MAEKEATVYILDVSPQMRATKDADGKTPQDRACAALFKMLNAKLITGRKTDVVALLLVGTAETKNILAEDEQGYQNISAYESARADEDALLYMADLDMIRFVYDGASKDEAAGDVFEGMIIAIQMLDKHCRHLKWKKKIYLFTNAENYMNDEGREDVVSKVKDMGVSMNIIGYGFDDPDRDIKHEDKSQTKSANEQALRSFVDEVEGLLFEGSEADFLLDQLRAKSIRPSKIAIPLSLGDPESHPEASLSLTVHVYTKTAELKIPSAKKFSGVAEQLPEDQRSDPTFGVVDMQRKYQLVQPDADDGGGGDEEGDEIDVEETIKAYRYGKTLVPFSEEDEAAMKLRTEKGLAILGFVKITKIPREAFMAGCLEIVPDQASSRSITIFTSIMQTLEDRQAAAIVRYCRIADANPKLGVMAPSKKGWAVFAQLPFAEDVRYYSFPPLEHLIAQTGTLSQSVLASMSQRDATLALQQSVSSGKKNKLDTRTVPRDEAIERVDALIDSMDLMEYSVDEEGNQEVEELFKPKNVFNPVYQRLYQCIAHRACHPDDHSLPPIDTRIVDCINPNPDVVEKSREALEKVKEAFTITKVQNDKVSSKRAWASRAAAAAGLDTEAVLDQNDENGPNKRVKTEEDNFGPDMSVRQLTERVVDKVGTVDPVSDFNAMFRRRDVDLISDAVQQMSDVTVKLITESFGDQLYPKAMDCLVALRAGCAKEDESDTFNSWLRELKRMLTQGAHTRHSEFWRRVVEKKITLITKEEAGDSNVARGEAEEFLQEEETTTATAPAAVAEADDEEDLPSHHNGLKKEMVSLTSPGGGSQLCLLLLLAPLNFFGRDPRLGLEEGMGTLGRAWQKEKEGGRNFRLEGLASESLQWSMLKWLRKNSFGSNKHASRSSSSLNLPPSPTSPSSPTIPSPLHNVVPAVVPAEETPAQEQPAVDNRRSTSPPEIVDEIPLSEKTHDQLVSQITQLQEKLTDQTTEISRLKKCESALQDNLEHVEAELAKTVAVLVNEKALHNETKSLLDEGSKGAAVDVAAISQEHARQVADMRELLFQSQRDRDTQATARKEAEVKLRNVSDQLRALQRKSVVAPVPVAAEPVAAVPVDSRIAELETKLERVTEHRDYLRNQLHKVENVTVVELIVALNQVTAHRDYLRNALDKVENKVLPELCHKLNRITDHRNYLHKQIHHFENGVLPELYANFNRINQHREYLWNQCQQLENSAVPELCAKLNRVTDHRDYLHKQCQQLEYTVIPAIYAELNRITAHRDCLAKSNHQLEYSTIPAIYEKFNRVTVHRDYLQKYSDKLEFTYVPQICAALVRVSAHRDYLRNVSDKQEALNIDLYQTVQRLTQHRDYLRKHNEKAESQMFGLHQATVRLEDHRNYLRRVIEKSEEAHIESLKAASAPVAATPVYEKPRSIVSESVKVATKPMDRALPAAAFSSAAMIADSFPTPPITPMSAVAIPAYIPSPPTTPLPRRESSPVSPSDRSVVSTSDKSHADDLLERVSSHRDYLRRSAEKTEYSQLAVFQELQRVKDHRNYLKGCIEKLEADALASATTVQRLEQHRDYLRRANEKLEAKELADAETIKRVSEHRDYLRRANEKLEDKELADAETIKRVSQHRDYLRKANAKLEDELVAQAHLVTRLSQHRDYLRRANEKLEDEKFEQAGLLQRVSQHRDYLRSALQKVGTSVISEICRQLLMVGDQIEGPQVPYPQAIECVSQHRDYLRGEIDRLEQAYVAKVAETDRINGHRNYLRRYADKVEAEKFALAGDLQRVSEHRDYLRRHADKIDAEKFDLATHLKRVSEHRDYLRKWNEKAEFQEYELAAENQRLDQHRDYLRRHIFSLEAQAVAGARQVKETSRALPEFAAPLKPVAPVVPQYTEVARAIVTLPESDVYHELERITQHRDYLQRCLAKHEAGDLEHAQVVTRLTQHRDYLRGASDKLEAENAVLYGEVTRLTAHRDYLRRVSEKDEAATVEQAQINQRLEQHRDYLRKAVEKAEHENVLNAETNRRIEQHRDYLRRTVLQYEATQFSHVSLHSHVKTLEMVGEHRDYLRHTINKMEDTLTVQAEVVDRVSKHNSYLRRALDRADALDIQRCTDLKRVEEHRAYLRRANEKLELTQFSDAALHSNRQTLDMVESHRDYIRGDNERLVAALADQVETTVRIAQHRDYLRRTADKLEDQLLEKAQTITRVSQHRDYLRRDNEKLDAQLFDQAQTITRISQHRDYLRSQNQKLEDELFALAGEVQKVTQHRDYLRNTVYKSELGNCLTISSGIPTSRSILSEDLSGIQREYDQYRALAEHYKHEVQALANSVDLNTIARERDDYKALAQHFGAEAKALNSYKALATNFGNEAHALESYRALATNFGNEAHALQSFRALAENFGSETRALSNYKDLAKNFGLEAKALESYKALAANFGNEVQALQNYKALAEHFSHESKALEKHASQLTVDLERVSQHRDYLRNALYKHELGNCLTISSGVPASSSQSSTSQQPPHSRSLGVDADDSAVQRERDHYKALADHYRNEAQVCAKEVRSVLTVLKDLHLGGAGDGAAALLERVQSDALQCANELRLSVAELQAVMKNASSPISAERTLSSTSSLISVDGVNYTAEELVTLLKERERQLSQTIADFHLAVSQQQPTGLYTYAELEELLALREQQLNQTIADFHYLASNQQPTGLYTYQELEELLALREQQLNQTTADFHLLASNQSGGLYTYQELSELLALREQQLNQTVADFHYLASNQTGGLYSYSELANLLKLREQQLNQTVADFHYLASNQTGGLYSYQELVDLLNLREQQLNQTVADFHLMASTQSKQADSIYTHQELVDLLALREQQLNQTIADFHLLQSTAVCAPHCEKAGRARAEKIDGTRSLTLHQYARQELLGDNRD